MKKLLLSFAAALMGMAAMAQTAVYTLTFGADKNSDKVSSYTGTFSVTDNGMTFNMAAFNNNNNGWDFVRCGRKNTASAATITTGSAAS